MPSFAIRDASELADFIIPVTQAMADEIVAHARTRDDETCVAAIYYLSGNREKPRRESILVTVVLDKRGDPFAFVWTGDYHPRSQGRAHKIFQTETYVHD